MAGKLPRRAEKVEQVSQMWTVTVPLVLKEQPNAGRSVIKCAVRRCSSWVRDAAASLFQHPDTTTTCCLKRNACMGTPARSGLRLGLGLKSDHLNP